MNSKSDIELAERISGKIKSIGLLNRITKDTLNELISSGNISSEDWVMFCENEILSTRKENNHAESH